MPKLIDVGNAQQVRGCLRLTGGIVDLETGSIDGYSMGFVREDAGTDGRPVLELARRSACPLGSLVCVPDHSDMQAEFYEPHEFHGDELMVAVFTKDAWNGEGTGNEIFVNPFCASGWNALRRIALTDDDAAPAAAAWVEELTILLDRVSAALEEDPAADLPDGLVAWMLCCRMADQIEVGALPTGIDYDMLSRYCAAAEIRRRICLISEGNRADPVRPLAELLGDLADRMEIDPGSRFRSVAITSAAQGEGGGDISTISRRNDSLVRRLFAGLTMTPVEQICCGVAPRDCHGQIVERLTAVGADGEAHNAGWREQVSAVVTNILEDTFGRAYRPRVAIREIAGNDILTVGDFAGCYVYSWPSTDRKVLFELEGQGQAFPMVDPSECPSPAELAGKMREYGQLLARSNEPEAVLAGDHRPADGPVAP